jgi:hypothetical protein
MPDIPQLEETNERLCYLVRSASHPKIAYRVDLLASKGAGFCQCIDHSTRRQPAIDQGQPIGTRSTMCRHVILARRHFLNGLLERLAKEENEPR